MARPYRKWGWSDLILLTVAWVPIIAAILLYTKLPDPIAIQIGWDNEPNNYQSKIVFLIVYGLIVLGIPILLKAFRHIDFKTESRLSIGHITEFIRFIMTIFASATLGFILMINMGEQVGVYVYVMLGLGTVCLLLGNFMVNIPFGTSFGWRTPWMLQDADNWHRTYAFTGPLWMLTGVMVLIGAFVPPLWAAWLTGGMVVLTVGVSTSYSYWLHRKKTHIPKTQAHG
ncbi:SdpI family protein [Brevibacillus dissolubilis]|uniref:SdpI family protein n=1 Tax=Brevibacillus dissolubilis TaxID=1844116 RepID=UPI0011172DD0|nr:SdpI family protein [Brevibacillus dissolubilis]